MVTSGVTAIKKSQMAHFFVFSADDSKKNSFSLGKLFKCSWGILLSSLRKCYGLWDSELLLARCQPLKIQGLGNFLLTDHFFLYISHQYLTDGNSKVSWPYHFLKEVNKNFLGALNALLNQWLTFVCHQQKIQKTICLHAKDDTFKPVNINILFLHKSC